MLGDRVEHQVVMQRRRIQGVHAAPGESAEGRAEAQAPFDSERSSGFMPSRSRPRTTRPCPARRCRRRTSLEALHKVLAPAVVILQEPSVSEVE